MVSDRITPVGSGRPSPPQAIGYRSAALHRCHQWTSTSAVMSTSLALALPRGRRVAASTDPPDGHKGAGARCRRSEGRNNLGGQAKRVATLRQGGWIGKEPRNSTWEFGRSYAVEGESPPEPEARLADAWPRCARSSTIQGCTGHDDTMRCAWGVVATEAGWRMGHYAGNSRLPPA